MSETNFQNEVVVVVGAASGIGRATAELFSKAGATVFGLDLAKFEPPYGNAIEVDATNVASLDVAVRNIGEQGRVDHVIVSIGMCSGTLGFPFWNLKPEQWTRVVDVNLVAPVNVAHAFVPLMLPQRRGSLGFVASVAGQIGSQTDPPYSAAKAGLINFAQCAAKDLAPYNIRSNAVSPGMVKTPMNRQVWEAWQASSDANDLSYDEWASEKIKQIAPLGRWQSEEDVANAICFLASDRARNITGQTINVDGGQVMHC